jgi:Na+/melibiose symporter-like transporter
MYAAPIPMALCFVLLFHPPADLSQAGLFFWMLAFAVGVRVAMTFYLIPSASLVPEMTQNYDERTSLLSFRVLASWIGGLASAQVGLLYFFAPSGTFADGRLDPAAYGDYALAGALAIALAILTCAIGTHRIIPTLRPPTGVGFSVRGFWQDLRQAFSIRSYVVMVLAVLTITLATGFTDVMNLYVQTYFWELSASQIAVIVYGALFGTVFAFAFTGRVSRRSDKRRAALSCMIAITFVGPAPVILRLLDWFPPNGHWALLPLLTLHAAFIIYVAVMVGILAGSMIADTVDENELASGKRQEGLFSASLGLTAKATSGLGGFVAGVVLDVIDFPTGVGPGEVDSGDLFALGLGVGPGIFLFWLTALLILSRYRLSREDHARIIAELNIRRAAESGTVSAGKTAGAGAAGS